VTEHGAARLRRTVAASAHSFSKRWLSEQGSDRLLPTPDARDFLVERHQVRFENVGGFAFLACEQVAYRR